MAGYNLEEESIEEVIMKNVDFRSVFEWSVCIIWMPGLDGSVLYCFSLSFLVIFLNGFQRFLFQVEPFSGIYTYICISSGDILSAIDTNRGF